MARFKSVVLMLLLVLIGGSNCLHRTLDYTFNEGCKDLCKNSKVKLGHVRATGSNDTLHYIWDFTRNPTIFIAVTSTTAKLVVDWNKYVSRLPHAVKFTEKPMYTFGIVIERLLEFNDIHDDGRMDEILDSNVVEVNFQNFQWHHKNLTHHDSFVEFYIQASDYKDLNTNETRNGTIEFLLQGFSTLNHSSVTPKMLHSENATQMDVTIDHLDTKANFTSSRFAFELLFVSENDLNCTLLANGKWKLDDEFTPGIFEIVELITSGAHDKSGYLQWRPVSYKNSNRETVKSTSTVSYPVKNASVNEFFNRDNFLYLYYGEDKMLDNLVQRVNISIGEKGDGFYKASNYATMTFVAGYGAPPDERFSFVVMLIIAIGIGIPVLVFLTTGVYKIMRSRRRRDNELIIE
ncbi:glycosylated lysosomal membrane protein B-like [Copidosoma floridanum]|uniref:glycosylated lysosomal membrane protein B-like n=1 Tax=Copidosoma floridanum TaxID=29053 RepID=UPI0006C9AA96|nr:glycosylated lysosomal membrane protein B-like [Copidosoma floridanum]